MRKYLKIIFCIIITIIFVNFTFGQSANYDNELLDLEKLSVEDISKSVLDSSLFMINFSIEILMWIIFTTVILMHLTKNKNKQFDFKIVRNSVNNFYKILQEYFIIVIFCLSFISIFSEFLIPVFARQNYIFAKIYNNFILIGSLILCLVVFPIKIFINFEKYHFFKIIISISISISYILMTIGIVEMSLNVANFYLSGGV